MPTTDEMESLKNQLVRLISHPDRHKNQFTQLGEPEQLRIRMDRLGRVL